MPTQPDRFDPYHKWLGIPVGEQPPHHYRLLGIDMFEADAEVIEHAADRQMAHLRTHQTGQQGPFSQKLLNEVAAAKLELLQPDRRAAYDRRLRARLSPTPAHVHGVPSTAALSSAALATAALALARSLPVARPVPVPAAAPMASMPRQPWSLEIEVPRAAVRRPRPSRRPVAIALTVAASFFAPVAVGLWKLRMEESGGPAPQHGAASGQSVPVVAGSNLSSPRVPRAEVSGSTTMMLDGEARRSVRD